MFPTWSNPFLDTATKVRRSCKSIECNDIRDTMSLVRLRVEMTICRRLERRHDSLSGAVGARIVPGNVGATIPEVFNQGRFAERRSQKEYLQGQSGSAEITDENGASLAPRRVDRLVRFNRQKICESLHSSLGDFGILFASTATHTDGTNDLTIDKNWHPTFQCGQLAATCLGRVL